jgi:hypothetical protein
MDRVKVAKIILENVMNTDWRISFKIADRIIPLLHSQPCLSREEIEKIVLQVENNRDNFCNKIIAHEEYQVRKASLICSLYSAQQQKGQEKLYPCAECGKLRTKDEGGTTFTVCDECWEKSHPHPEEIAELKRSELPWGTPTLKELEDRIFIIANKLNEIIAEQNLPT